MEQKKIVPKEMEIEIIEESDMEFVPRGRKSNLSDDFVKNIKNSIEKSNAVSMKKFDFSMLFLRNSQFLRI
jgi:hypothetical protein